MDIFAICVFVIVGTIWLVSVLWACRIWPDTAPKAEAVADGAAQFYRRDEWAEKRRQMDERFDRRLAACRSDGPASDLRPARSKPSNRRDDDSGAWLAGAVLLSGSDDRAPSSGSFGSSYTPGESSGSSDCGSSSSSSSDSSSSGSCGGDY